MLAPDSRLRANDAEIAATAIDGEVIMINLSNGVYYSLDHAGGLIYTLVAEGRTVAEIVEEVVRRYDVGPGQAEADTRSVLAQLLDERLVLLRSDRPAAVPPDGPAGGERLPYLRPALNIYRDMEDLLALDPPMPSLPEVPWKEPGDRASG
jgi:hypothetical protein